MRLEQSVRDLTERKPKEEKGIGVVTYAVGEQINPFELIRFRNTLQRVRSGFAGRCCPVVLPE